MHYTYSDTFAQTISSTHGAYGTQWLKELPNIIDQCANMWQLTDLKPFKSLTYNYVLSGVRHAKPIVLKIRCDQKALEKEVVMLQAYADLWLRQSYSHIAKILEP